MLGTGELLVGDATDSVYGGVISGGGSQPWNGCLEKEGAGRLTLSGANTYAGRTTIEAGTLALGANNALPAGSAVELAGGTLSAAGFSQTNTLGALSLQSNSTIDMGGASSVLKLADSSSIAWSGMLTVADWNGAMNGGGANELFFGSSASGLAASELNQIVFTHPDGLPDCYQATILATGEVVPGAMIAPEPAAFVLLASGGLLLVVLALRGRRRQITVT